MFKAEVFFSTFCMQKTDSNTYIGFIKVNNAYVYIYGNIIAILSMLFQFVHL